jgi:hypothetical protein
LGGEPERFTTLLAGSGPIKSLRDVNELDKLYDELGEVRRT